MSFGKRLKEARQSKKYTQLEVAEILGIDDTTISKYENNKSEPDNETLKKLAALYGKSTDELLGKTPSQEEAIQDLINYLMDPNTTINGDPLPPELRDDLLTYVRVFQATKNKNGKKNP